MENGHVSVNVENIVASFSVVGFSTLTYLELLLPKLEKLVVAMLMINVLVYIVGLGAEDSL